MADTTDQTDEQDAQTRPDTSQSPDQVTDTPEAAQTSQGDPEEDQEQQENDGNREAAKYRRRLRETEAERDALAAWVEALQRAEVERLTIAERVKPEALWASGAQLADLLAEDGTVDASRVSVAANAAADTLGLNRPRGNHVPREGRNTAGTERKGPTFADAFAPRDA